MFPTLQRDLGTKIAVRFLQTLLGVKVDGEFGPRTEAAVCVVQRQHSLPVTGIVDAATWGALASRIQAWPTWDYAWARGETDDVREAIHLATRQVGQRELEDPPNYPSEGLQNAVLGYKEFRGIKGDAFPPWCMIWLSSIIRVALDLPKTRLGWRAHPFGEWFGAVAELEEWTLAQPGIRRLKEPEIGALFTMDRAGSGSDISTALKSGHTGIVIFVEEGDEHFWSIEGNVDNRVVVQRRATKTARLFVRWWDEMDLAAARDFGGGE